MGSFGKVLATCRAIARELPGAVFIGGVAVYLHAEEAVASGVDLEASHDADLMISLLDYSSLRDTDELTANRRLGKHQMTRQGIEVDVYVERQSRLVVPYDEAAAHAEEISGVRAACLEHLLALKLEALLDRAGSAKGDKDERDVVRICLMLGKKGRRRLIDPFLGPRHEEALRLLARSQIFAEMSGGNAHAARKMRTRFDASIGRLGRERR